MVRMGGWFARACGSALSLVRACLSRELGRSQRDSRGKGTDRESDAHPLGPLPRLVLVGGCAALRSCSPCWRGPSAAAAPCTGDHRRGSHRGRGMDRSARSTSMGRSFRGRDRRRASRSADARVRTVLPYWPIACDDNALVPFRVRRAAEGSLRLGLAVGGLFPRGRFARRPPDRRPRGGSDRPGGDTCRAPGSAVESGCSRDHGGAGQPRACRGRAPDRLGNRDLHDRPGESPGDLRADVSQHDSRHHLGSGAGGRRVPAVRFAWGAAGPRGRARGRAGCGCHRSCCRACRDSSAR